MMSIGNKYLLLKQKKMDTSIRYDMSIKAKQGKGSRNIALDL
jgi:hypothetical protein